MSEWQRYDWLEPKDSESAYTRSFQPKGKEVFPVLAGSVRGARLSRWRTNYAIPSLRGGFITLVVGDGWAMLPKGAKFEDVEKKMSKIEARWRGKPIKT